jgi:hypothetical protein
MRLALFRLHAPAAFSGDSDHALARAGSPLGLGIVQLALGGLSLSALHPQLSIDAAGGESRPRNIRGAVDQDAPRRADRGVACTAPGFVDTNFAPERIAKIAGKQGVDLKARLEMARHLRN